GEIGAALTGQAYIENPGSAGFCHPTVKIKVYDDQACEVANGPPGRIWIKTPTAISEYWKRPDTNAENFCDGWFDTEDIGYLDENGYLYLSDRAKDLIIRGGENTYPAEVETVLTEHPAIVEVAAFGIANKKLGDQVAIAIVPGERATLSEEDAKAFAKENLAAFKVP
ncbi:MAG: long-chain acyl-CoA synthetase, partial [Cryomorphaceae bacterium]